MLLSLLVLRVVSLIHTGSGFVPVIVGPKGLTCAAELSMDVSSKSQTRGVHCICCFWTNRLLTTWLIVDSTNAVVRDTPGCTDV
jgi:hypothetical protein